MLNLVGQIKTVLIAEWEGEGLTGEAKEAFIKVKGLMPEVHILLKKK